MTARDLLDAAWSLYRSDARSDRWWTRGVALLARQAIEQALREWARAEAPGVQAATFRAQLLCFASESGRTGADQAPYLWSRLSSACHFNGYELPPSGRELKRWLEATEPLLSTPGGR